MSLVFKYSGKFSKFCHEVMNYNMKISVEDLNVLTASILWAFFTVTHTHTYIYIYIYVV